VFSTNKLQRYERLIMARSVFEELEWEPFGKVVAFGDPFWPKEYGPLSTILCTELLRLNKLFGTINNQSNQKHLGMAGKLYWLVLAQDFVRNWTAQHLGEAIDLSPAHLADLIDAARWAMEKRRRRLASPENLYRALRRFRKNPLNQTFCELASRKFQS
jgi:hypothetical protein